MSLFPKLNRIDGIRPQNILSYFKFEKFMFISLAFTYILLMEGVALGGGSVEIESATNVSYKVFLYFLKKGYSITEI